MTENDFQTLIQSWENLWLLVRHVADYPQYLDIVMTKALDDSQPENWRAAWMVDKIHEKHPEMVLPYFPVITNFLLTTNNSGKKRHFIKILSLHPVLDENMALLLDFSINIFTNPSEDISVRVHAMQILCNIAEKEPDFSGELIDLIEYELEHHGSAGMSARGKKILKKLHKIKNKSRLSDSR